MSPSLELSALEFRAPKPAGKSAIPIPPANESYFYAASRLLSAWPIINGNNATFFDEKLAPLMKKQDSEEGAVGKLANLNHSRGTSNRVIGSIQGQHYMPGVGIDIVTRIDRGSASTYGLEPEDFAKDGEYSSVSVEMFCDRAQSEFIVVLDEENSADLSKQKVMSAEEAETAGVTRTWPNLPEPYLYKGKYRVVEACSPIRCLGAAFTDDPADPTARVFELAASRGAVEKKPDENAGMGLEDSPTMYDDPFSDISHNYTDVETAGDMNGESRNELPDAAFGATYTDHDGQATIRKLPLYDSPKAYKAGKPNPGHVKAAMEALTKGFRGQRVDLPSNVRAEAINKVRAAHDKVFPKGKSKMAEHSEVLSPEAELARLKGLIEQAETKQTEAASTATRLQTQIDELTAIVAERDTEIASLKQVDADRVATEKASKRLEDLKTMGFEVKDEESAALLETLKAESDVEYRLRKKDIEIAQLRAGSVKTETSENTPNPEETAAALRVGLSDTPEFTENEGDKTKTQRDFILAGV